jgi:hypothetical protein
LTGLVELVDNTNSGGRRVNGPAHGNGTEVRMPAQRTYYLNGYVKIVAASDEEADRLFEQAGLGIMVEVVEGVTLEERTAGSG